MQRRISVDGKRYVVSTRGADNYLTVAGPGIRQWPYLLLPEGTRIDDAGIGELVRREVRAYLAQKRERRAVIEARRAARDRDMQATQSPE